jgi:HD-like signal output (HDOD) protein
MFYYINMHEKVLAVKERIQNLSSLPSLAVVKYQLVKTLSKESASVDDLAEIISHDPAITSRIMAIANSAFFGYSGRISSIDQAVLLLGFDLVRSIALATSMFNAFAGRDKNLKRIWAHSYVVGSLAGNLCARTKCAEKGSGFLSGLLHDIGRLVIFRIAVDNGQEVGLSELSGLKGIDLLKGEMDLLGCTHPQASKWFLDYLCFPEDILRPIETSHNPAVISREDIVSRVICIAESLAPVICPDLDNDGVWTEDHEIIMSELGLAQSDLVDLRELVEKERSSVAEFFDL